MERSTYVISEKVRNHIPNDLVFSILSKLPIKSLKRFECVCKSWAFLFENPYFMNIFRNNFISNHNSYYEDTSLLLHTRKYYQLCSLSGERSETHVELELPNPFQEDYPRFEILESGSITGILCLHIYNQSVVLWNPATGEVKVIPLNYVDSLAPHRHNMPHLHGFGFDNVGDDYKLIRDVRFIPLSSFDFEFSGMKYEEDVDRSNISYDPIWEIYSLKSNSWKKLNVDMPGCETFFKGEQLFMDGICYWWGFSRNDEASLVSFDLSNEMYFTTPMPLDIPLDIVDSFDINFVRRHLVVLNGSIALISFYCDTTIFYISILGEPGVKESWTKLFIVGPLPCIENPIGVGMKGNIFFRKYDDELVMFDLCTNETVELGVKGEYPSCIMIYKENFLPIEGINH